MSKKLFGFIAFLFLSSPLFAQWTTQEVTLRPGWNAVFLEVQPEPKDPDTLFSGLPIASVWAWNKRFSTVQFIQDPNQLVPTQPDWLSYFPPDKEDAVLNNLFAIQGGRSYLINIAGTENVEWSFKGRPVARTVDWVGDSLNLAGFHIDGNSPPPFADFLAPSSAHFNPEADPKAEVYRLASSGAWQPVTALSAESINAGEAYWIRSEKPSQYAGPLTVAMAQGNTIRFGRTLQEQVVRITNESSGSKTVTVNPLPSESPPNNAQMPALAGPVALSHWVVDFANDRFGWEPLTDPLSRELAAHETWILRLSVRRVDMAPPPGGGGDSLYQSLLEVKDNAGVKWLLPVTAEGLYALGENSASSFDGQSLQTSGESATAISRTGLWVGTAVINAVSEPAHPSDPNTPRETDSEVQFRLIIHVDESGQTRLLQQALFMWKNGQVDAEGNVTEPGRYVLLTDDALIPQYTGSTLRDGQSVGRRVSSVAFGFSEPQSLTGNFGQSLEGAVTTAYDDPLNPFKHRYHPDHNNLDNRFEETLPEGQESFTITRALTLQFTAEDPEDLPLAGWGDNQMGGIYYEKISGVHKNAIYIQGFFRLQQVSQIGKINQ